MSWPHSIPYVALCGWPEGGKDTVARMLVEEFGMTVVDDGLILRQAVPVLFGIPHDEPFTHDGKAKVYDLHGRRESVRQMLGELGNYLEERYGQQFIPTRAIESTRGLKGPFVFSSVRRNQGISYRAHGGIVIEVDNPLVSDSGNIWDAWEPVNVDIRIRNDPRATKLGDLREIVKSLPNVIARMYNNAHEHDSTKTRPEIHLLQGRTRPLQGDQDRSDRAGYVPHGLPAGLSRSYASGTDGAGLQVVGAL